ncbi:MAG: hypothetical protein AAF840_00885, partial [Bacteroidota bacterium]
IKQYGFGADLSYRRTPNDLRSEVLAEDFLILEKLLPNFTVSSTTLSIRGDKYITSLKTDIRANLRYSKLEDQLSLGATVVPIQTNLVMANLRLSTRIFKKVVFSSTVDYAAFSNQLDEVTSRQQQLKLQQQVVIKFDKRLKFQTKLNTYLPRLGQATSINLWQAALDFELPDQDLKLGLTARNILNQQVVLERSISSYQRTTEQYQLRPRTISMALTKSF